MAERPNAAVLKTVDGKLSGGSNPSPCAKREKYENSFLGLFVFFYSVLKNIPRVLTRGYFSLFYGYACSPFLGFKRKNVQTATPATKATSKAISPINQ